MANANGTKTDVAVLKSQMKDFRTQNDKDHAAIMDEVQSMRQDFKDFMQSCDSRYAPKIVEKIVYTIIGASGLTILGIVLNWIFSQKLL